jgi:hypothetical protein
MFLDWQLSMPSVGYKTPENFTLWSGLMKKLAFYALFAG